ncbi:unnamed protein product [Schistocephalus solidus]|uniref:Uncharacterized protein n=1 Tax=Schistocephalus solidus TaxID=70667 RepID=A0A183THI9_SCHSO|nr:unnamed protein product [Schistocephalus solidus]
MDVKPDAARALGPPVIRLTPAGPRPIVVRTVSSTAPVVIGSPPPQKQKVYKVIAFVPAPTPRQVSPNNALTTLPLAVAKTKDIVTPHENFARSSANSQPNVQEPLPPPTDWSTKQQPPSPCPSHQRSPRASLLASHLHQIAELAALASSTDLQQMSIHLQQLEDEWRDELLNNSPTAATHDDATSHFPSSASASLSPTPLSDATEACEGEYGMDEEENDCEEKEGEKSNVTETYESAHADPATSSSGHHRNIAPILLQLGQTDLASKSSHGSLRTAPKRKLDALRN